MIDKLRLFFINHHWIELLIVPPVLVGVGYFIYGEVYFESWSNFAVLTLPWAIFSMLVSVSCKWWQGVMSKRFRELDDLWKRLIFSFLGYLLLHAICIFVLLYVLKSLPIVGFSLVVKRFFFFVILDFSFLAIFTTFYEGELFFHKWRTAIAETEQLEKLTLESQFRSLQSQLNPHFLFNSFNVLSSLIAENPRRAEDFVDELSNVYRYLMRSNEQELATVGEELRFIRSFFHLLQTRHGAGIALKIDVASKISPKKVPALALQVLVENAVKHNEISPEKPLLMEIFEKNDRLIVRNNVQIKKTKAMSNHVGLSNLEERYHLLKVKGFEVRADERVFEVVLPLIV